MVSKDLVPLRCTERRGGNGHWQGARKKWGVAWVHEVH